MLIAALSGQSSQETGPFNESTRATSAALRRYLFSAKYCAEALNNRHVADPSCHLQSIHRLEEREDPEGKLPSEVGALFSL